MTYFGVVLRKEKVHWKRMWTMLKQFKGLLKIIGLIGIVFLSIVHYAYVAMHTAYETALFLFNRDAFNSNLFKLKASLVK